MRLYGRPTLEFEVLEIKRFFLQMSQKIEVLYQTTPRNETHTHTHTHTHPHTHTHTHELDEFSECVQTIKNLEQCQLALFWCLYC